VSPDEKSVQVRNLYRRLVTTYVFESLEGSRAYIVLLFQLGMHLEVDGRSDVVSGCGALEKVAVVTWRRKSSMRDA
jgi:hypothetical protein